MREELGKHKRLGHTSALGSPLDFRNPMTFHPEFFFAVPVPLGALKDIFLGLFEG